MLGFIGYWVSTLLLALALLGVIVLWFYIIAGVVFEVRGFFQKSDPEEKSGYWSEDDRP